MNLYPIGYAAQLVDLGGLRAKHEPRMHPEFARRLFAYLEHRGGELGIGGGWRLTQPPKPGFAAEGRSFHQYQTFASGLVAYAAVDLVIPNPVGVHRAPGWNDTADAPEWGLHAFIKSPPEPWHMQPIELAGYGRWVTGDPDEGLSPRIDPVAGFPLPTGPTMPGGQFVHATIRKGDVNADVYAAQVVLRLRAGQPHVVADGKFGAQTEAAVRSVQAYFGLTVDGVVGPKTWALFDTLANG